MMSSEYKNLYIQVWQSGTNRESVKIQKLAEANLSSEELDEFVTYLKLQEHPQEAEWLLKQKGNILKLTASFALAQEKDGLNFVNIRNLLGIRAVSSDGRLNNNPQQDKLGIGGASNGYKQKFKLPGMENSADCLVKTGGGYCSDPGEYSIKESNEIVAIKESYAAEVYSFLSGHQEIDYRLLVNKEAAANKVDVLSVWLDHAFKFDLRNINKENEKERVQFLEIIIISQLFGDIDAHPGNMLQIQNDDGIKTLRIDFGYAFKQHFFNSEKYSTLNHISLQTLTAFYNEMAQKHGAPLLPDNYFQPMDLVKACQNITNRMTADKDKLTAIAARHEALLDPYRNRAGIDNDKKKIIVGETSAAIYNLLEDKLENVKNIANSIENIMKTKLSDLKDEDHQLLKAYIVGVSDQSKVTLLQVESSMHAMMTLQAYLKDFKYMKGAIKDDFIFDGHRSFTNLIENVIKEAISNPKIKITGSKELEAVMRLPPEVKAALDPNLMKQAEKYSKHVGERFSEKIQQVSKQVSNTVSKKVEAASKSAPRFLFFKASQQEQEKTTSKKQEPESFELRTLSKK